MQRSSRRAFSVLLLIATIAVSLPSRGATSDAGDICADLSSRLASVPVAGGTVDLRDLQGSRSCAEDPFAGSNKPLRVLIGDTTITSSVSWKLGSGTVIEGASEDRSRIVFRNPAAELPAGIIVSGGNNVQIVNLTLQGGEMPGVRKGVELETAAHIVFAHVRLLDFGHVSPDPKASAIAAFAGNSISDVEIRDSEITGTGTASPTVRTSYDIVVGNEASNNARLTILRNYIHGSNTAFSVALFDTNHSQVNENTIDQNNRRWYARGNILSIGREDNWVTVTVPDTSEMYAGGDDGSSVIIRGTRTELDQTFPVVPVKVVDASHFSFPSAGDDVPESRAGGTWAQSANNDGYGVMYYTTVRATPQSACHDNQVNGNKISNTSGNGILLQGSPRTEVKNNQLYDTDKEEVPGSHPAGAIAVNGGNRGAKISDVVVISGNKIDTVGFNGIDVANSEGIAISSNSIENIGSGYGIRLRGQEPNATITGNTIRGGRRGISADGDLANAQIQSNTIKDWDGPSAGGIVVAGASKGVVVSGNILSSGGNGQAVIFTSPSASNDTINGNIITGRAGQAIIYRGRAAKISNNQTRDARR